MQKDVTCGICRKTYKLTVDAEAYRAWQAGAHIQDVMPGLSADDRELLISGTCGPCFAVLFPEDDE